MSTRSFHHFSSLFFILLFSLIIGCNQPPKKTIENSSRIKLAIVGQSLIKVDPRKHWTNPYASIKPILQSADLAFTNFEMAVDDQCGLPDDYQVVLGKPELKENAPGNTDGPHAVNEDVMEFLSSMNFRLQSLANNHAWDLGNCGIKATMAAADKYGVTHAGTGNNIEEASQAAYIEIKGVKIALIAATTSLDERELILPTEARPGVNGVWTGWKEDWDLNIQSVKTAKQQADLVIYYQHFQIKQKDADGKGKNSHKAVGDMFEWQESFAKAIIDAGAGMFIAHGDRIFDGLEIYNGRPIFRQFGGFSYQGLQDIGSYDPLVWEGLLGMLTIENGYIREIEIIPLKLDEGAENDYKNPVDFREKRGFSEIAKGDQAESILNRFKKLSLEYGTNMSIRDGKAMIEIPETDK